MSDDLTREALLEEADRMVAAARALAAAKVREALGPSPAERALTPYPQVTETHSGLGSSV